MRSIRLLRKIIPNVLHHHECVDGSGYPDGLKGESIPLISRIISVADTFDAMTSDRPYRKGLSAEKSLEELRKFSDIQFDRSIVDAFHGLVDEGDLKIE